MFNLGLYEEGVEAGIERGQYILLVELLNKKLGEISEKYISKLECLENSQIKDIALNIFNIVSTEDLDKHLF